MFIISFVILMLLLLIGSPIWLALAVGGASIFAEMGMPLSSFSRLFFTSADSWILLAVPYFLFAGGLMTYMGPADKMFTFINNLVGHLPGGLAAAVVATSAFFGALSGSSVATAVAVGSMAIPQMLAKGYSKENSTGIIASSSTLGQMIPPSTYMIIYASMTQVDVGQLFISGIVPGLVITAVLIVVAVMISYREKAQRQEKSTTTEKLTSFVQALPTLFMPIIVLGGIYTGIVTPTEAAAVAIVYVLIISYLFNREKFTKENLMKCLTSTMVTTSIVYILLGGAALFSTGLTVTQIPQRITEFAVGLAMPDMVILLMILLVFFIFGTVLEPLPILYITLPILYPTVLSLGLDPIHFAILTVILMMISQITPPVGMTLFAVSGYFKQSLGSVVKGSMPYLYGLIIATVILLLFPWLSTVLVQ